MSTDPTQERFAIVITAGGLIMGALIDLGETWELRKPRAVQIQPVGNGVSKMMFLELVGSPAVIVFTGDVDYFLPTQPTVIQGYQESVSPIKLASQLPRQPGRAN